MSCAATRGAAGPLAGRAAPPAGGPGGGWAGGGGGASGAWATVLSALACALASSCVCVGVRACQSKRRLLAAVPIAVFHSPQQAAARLTHLALLPKLPLLLVLLVGPAVLPQSVRDDLHGGGGEGETKANASMQLHTPTCMRAAAARMLLACCLHCTTACAQD